MNPCPPWPTRAWRAGVAGIPARPGPPGPAGQGLRELFARPLVRSLVSASTAAGMLARCLLRARRA
jgi:hypothetical protein